MPFLDLGSRIASDSTQSKKGIDGCETYINPLVPSLDLPILNQHVLELAFGFLCRFSLLLAQVSQVPFELLLLLSLVFAEFSKPRIFAVRLFKVAKVGPRRSDSRGEECTVRFEWLCGGT